MSLERIDNAQGYIDGNYTLIANEFNSARAQWSREKVLEVPILRNRPVNLEVLRTAVAKARVKETKLFRFLRHHINNLRAKDREMGLDPDQTITVDEGLDIIEAQHGRCYHTQMPLSVSG
eukprot:CAMPEP_0170158588 /NCGR_PEP_ID=MMETSP0033_2-20121228/68628_1 /TAXON_ID=195969 /ORGANISM="Dolichomastix tenuilepis, Strain CCMP3274" /LENGTH=119 /DNA_ID=CAMNT_0010396031 /DNA_START=31 /DNA_END=386 /DNA_ORIENTATION=+